MSTFVPSKYQKTVYTYLQKGKGNAVINAVAGSGKSTTIINALKLIPSNKNVLFLAFNKSIVEELKIKIGSLTNVEVRTLHSLGTRSLFKAYKSQIDDNKYVTWLNNGINSGFIQPSDNLGDKLGEWKNNIIKLIDLGRVNLIKSEIELEELAFKHNLILIDNETCQAMKGISWGVKEVATIDYTDMIYLPVVKDLRLYHFDWVFIDECQDLNAAQRNLFLKCVKPNGGRFIAVGDPRQAIYGFAGADVESFNLLGKIPHTVKLPLSVCYRCDGEIIQLAKEIVPQIEARDNAAPGVVCRDSKMSDIEDGDMVLCRVSAPLVAMCMRYISQGVKAYVKGRDIGKNLINMISKTRKKKMTDVMLVLERELSRIIGKVVAKMHCSEKEARESEMYRIYQDKLDAISIIAEGLEEAEEVIDRIDTIFSDDSKNGICLSTVHKSKGLESNRVFIICPDKFYLKSCMKIPWMAEQERNLVYVAYTRAKHFLGFVTDFKM